MAADTLVPDVDISGCAASTAQRNAVAAAIDRAFRDVGFLVITGHGVPSALIGEAFAAARAFFALPVGEKLAARPSASDVFRGYNGVASQRSGNVYNRGLPADLRENFLISRLDVSDPYYRRPEFGNTYAANIWPKHPAEYRAVWSRFYREMDALAHRLMRICALGLGVAENFFEDKTDRCSSTCVANYYPAQPEAPVPGQLRAGMHSDVGSVTLLVQERAHGGLQVLGKDAAWHDVVTERDAVIVNVGDLLAQWTNDRWVSTKHRVVNPPREHASDDRMSLSFFQHPNYDATVECVATCTGPGNPPRYAPTTAGEHMHRRMLAAREWRKADAAQ
jgi:isopenicillin N synthase-like dioxygenase